MKNLTKTLLGAAFLTLAACGPDFQSNGVDEFADESVQIDPTDFEVDAVTAASFVCKGTSTTAKFVKSTTGYTATITSGTKTTQYKCTTSSTGALTCTAVSTLGTGGVPSTGGAKAAGGAISTGGFKAAGGAISTGGFKVAGGAISTGGFKAAGGAISTGGFKAAGGAISTGGFKAAGGAISTGGFKAAGGAISTGGFKAAGGAISTGGFKAAGGDISTGVVLSVTSTGASGKFGSEPLTCSSTPTTGTDLKYADVSAIINTNCGICHANFKQYATVQTKAKAMATALSSGRMPKNNPPFRLSADGKKLLTWLQAGAPQ